ncbi:S-adenosyl-L-methionine-dependent methyltransferase [Suillus subalutaceus]|uniref:S-adenosyl-L-methionine-dependent methyltransferase n=1 Tax=Suillus subalutaceus TaxID=48586 RepID=UPI001B85BCC4|nr:S-adenosyl-L-methionine-dependent methyltransferase [Suillus subalutaceus]KAG1871844.1 S-adenosyl-L-methionine-dependent methyltransferase [Suillus subalutaceus]
MNANNNPPAPKTRRVLPEIQTTVYRRNRFSLPMHFRAQTYLFVFRTDADEHERLRLQHNALKIFMDGNNHIVPIEDEGNFQRVLDLCSGSGQWVVDVAESLPNAEVHGVDLALPQIFGNSEIPSNVQFHKVDLLNQPLPFADCYFDIVQMRIVPSIPNRIDLLKEISRVLWPGGYVMFFEPGASFSGTQGTRTAALTQVDRLIIQSPHTPSPGTGDDNGMIWSLAPKIASMLQDAVDNQGNALFYDVSSLELLIPIGGWPDDEKLKSVGSMMAEVQMGLVDAFRPKFIELQLLTDAEFSALQTRVLAEVEDPTLELQQPFVAAWGRKVAENSG